LDAYGDGNLYFGNDTRFTLTADPGNTVTLLNFNFGQWDADLSDFTVLDHNGDTLATVSGVGAGSMADFAWPTLTDTQLTIVFGTTQVDYSWINNITFSEQATALRVELDTPADTQGYPTGTSIMATATVADPGGFTDTVTFHTTRINPPGSTVDTVSTDTSSPFTADLGALAGGTYEIYATVANNDEPPGAATSAIRTFTVAPAIPTTTELGSSAISWTYGQNVTFTATVSPPPTGGTVQFWDGGNYLGDPVTVHPGTGEATYSTTTLGAGAHEITADYSGHWLHEPSAATALSCTVEKAELTVRALNALRAPNTPNPDPFPHQITGYQNGEGLATSGVTGTPDLTTDAVLESPPADYVITTALGDLAASNYSFTLVNGTLTVAEVADTFSVNFYAYPGWMTSAEDRANLQVPVGVPAGIPGDWYTSGWLNVEVPWGGGLQPTQTLTSNKGATASFIFKDCRNGWNWGGDMRTSFLGDGNGNMMDGHVNSTLNVDPPKLSNKFDMEMTDIPFAVYDVIFYMGANDPQYGDGKGKIVFNGGAERDFTVKRPLFDGTFTEMVDATTPGNYIVFKGVTGSSFTTQTWGMGPNDFNHIGPHGFQIREAAGASGYSAWAATNGVTGGVNGDSNSDGIQNGIAYFMNNTGLITNPGIIGNTVTWPNGGNMPATEYGAAKQFVVQTSPDLVTWTPVAVEDLTTNTSGPDGSLSYTLPTGLGRYFVRLLVTPAP
jgi:hypothetical protein